MTTLDATRKLMKLTQAADGALTLEFRVRINPQGLVTVNSQPVGNVDSELGYASAYEHFALQMTELRKAELRRGKEAAARARTNIASPD